VSSNLSLNDSQLPSTACKLCGAATADLMERNGFRIVQCGQCRFMFALVPQGYDAASIYKDDVYFTSGGECGIADYDALWRRRLAHFYIPRLDRVRAFQQPARLLDIGCASGYLMKAAQERGWRAAGVELSPAMRLRAAELTHGTIYESIGQALDSGERFECVTMFEVIEHLSDPVATVAQVAELLVPGGVLALSTPNCECPGAAAGVPINVWFDPPEHICYFGVSTIRQCLETAGFETLAIEGLEHYCRAMAGDLTFPRWVTAALTPFRRGKRLKPGGLLGKVLERAYHDRMDLYRRTDRADLPRTDVLEVYARRVK
jgi:SAM-dependent methyltransferase